MNSTDQVWTTSGTTGEPKRVVLTEDNIRFGTIGFALGHRAARSDIFLRCCPPDFSADLLHKGWDLIGATVVRASGFDAGSIIEDIEKHSVTVTVMTPRMIQAMIDHPDFRPGRVASLRVLVHGGDPIERDLLEFCIEAGLPMACSYGLTECGPDVTTFDVDEERAAYGTDRMMSVGRPHVFNEVKIQDGTLRVRGPNVGRYEDEVLNAERFDGDWFDTRDEARIDSDGYVYITGRSGAGVCR